MIQKKSTITIVCLVLFFVSCVSIFIAAYAYYLSKASRNNSLTIGNVEFVMSGTDDTGLVVEEGSAYFHSTLEIYNGSFAPESYAQALEMTNSDNGKSIADAKITLTREQEREVFYGLSLRADGYSNNAQFSENIKVTGYLLNDEGTDGTLTAWNHTSFGQAEPLESRMGAGSKTYHIFITAESASVAGYNFSFDIVLDSALKPVTSEYAMETNVVQSFHVSEQGNDIGILTFEAWYEGSEPTWEMKTESGESVFTGEGKPGWQIVEIKDCALNETGDVALQLGSNGCLYLREIQFDPIERRTVELPNVPETDLNAGGTFEIDLTDYELTEAEFVSATLAGKEIATNIESNVLSVTADPQAFAQVWGEQSLEIVINEKAGEELTRITTLKGKVLIITMIVYDATGIDSIYAKSKACETDSNYWGGYFVLGQDIDYNKSYSGNNTIAPATTQMSGYGYGFRGVIDGAGYKIEGMKFGGWLCGFIGVLNENGVLRNLTFTKAKLAGFGSFLCCAGVGRIENVYIQVDEYTAYYGDGNAISGFIYGSDCMAMARVVNCFVDITGTVNSSGGTAYFGAAHEGYGIYTNVYYVCQSGAGYRKLGDGTGAKNIFGSYTDRNAMKEANIAVTEENGWDLSFWTTDADGLPIPKNLA